MPSVFGNVRQLGFISRDLDRSMAWFIDSWGIGPWYTLRNVKSAMLHKGEPVDLEMSIALAHCGDMQFEKLVSNATNVNPVTGAITVRRPRVPSQATFRRTLARHRSAGPRRSR